MRPQSVLSRSADNEMTTKWPHKKTSEASEVPSPLRSGGRTQSSGACETSHILSSGHFMVVSWSVAHKRKLARLHSQGLKPHTQPHKPCNCRSQACKEDPCPVPKPRHNTDEGDGGRPTLQSMFEEPSKGSKATQKGPRLSFWQGIRGDPRCCHKHHHKHTHTLIRKLIWTPFPWLPNWGSLRSINVSVGTPNNLSRPPKMQTG